MLFKGLKNSVKKEIATKYSLHHKTLISWMHFLTYIRNLCAHHSRLWNKELAIKPVLNDFEKQIPSDFIPQNNRSFIAY
jgi:abortive infection bacteriophage resistance protein